MVIVNTMSIVVMGLSYRYLAQRWIEVPRGLSKEHARGMIRFLIPVVPGSVYQSLQGQCSLFFITAFGPIGPLASGSPFRHFTHPFFLLTSSHRLLLPPF